MIQPFPPPPPAAMAPAPEMSVATLADPVDVADFANHAGFGVSGKRSQVLPLRFQLK